MRQNPQVNFSYTTVYQKKRNKHQGQKSTPSCVAVDFSIQTDFNHAKQNKNSINTKALQVSPQ